MSFAKAGAMISLYKFETKSASFAWMGAAELSCWAAPLVFGRGVWERDFYPPRVGVLMSVNLVMESFE